VLDMVSLQKQRVEEEVKSPSDNPNHEEMFKNVEPRKK
jgi:hypothetical protein